jgi:serine/threonine protein kinase
MALNLKTETVFTDDTASARAPLPPDQIAPHFPQLQILECLGRGGMGVIYKARQKTLNRLVALKLLAPERVGDAKFAERFVREAQALAALNHPNIVTIYDFGQAGGFFFLLMEFVDGLSLRQLLTTRKFTPEEALAIVPPLCDALQYAHNRGIVHRDIKPENLLLDKEGRVKVADFGIAKMLRASNRDIAIDEPAAPASTTQTTLGTPGYSAPEQKTDPQRVDSRADIYSLGVVLYELLTGELPGQPLEPPSRKVQIDVRLDEVVLRALEQKPERRYQQASVLKTQVETVAGARGRKASPGLPDEVLRSGKTLPRLGRRVPLGTSLAIICLLLLPLFAMIAYNVWQEKVNSTPTSSPVVQPPALPFGPVIERVLVDVDEPGTNKALRFQTGELGSPPAGAGLTPEWMLARQMDLAVRKWSNRWSLITRGLKLRRYAWRRFEDATGRDVMNTLFEFYRYPSDLETVGQAFLIPEDAQLPWTLAFRTDKEQGLLQIMSFTGNPPGMKVRYKLVQRPTSSVPQHMQAEPTERGAALRGRAEQLAAPGPGSQHVPETAGQGQAPQHPPTVRLLGEVERSAAVPEGTRWRTTGPGPPSPASSGSSWVQESSSRKIGPGRCPLLVLRTEDPLESAISTTRHPGRFGQQAGKPNENCLNAELFAKAFLKPCEAVRPAIGLLMFEFSRFWPSDYEHAPN